MATLSPSEAFEPRALLFFLGIILIDSVFQLLFRYEKPLSRQKIGLTLGNPKGVKELLSHLNQDDRFIALEDDHWQAAAMEDLVEDQDLEEVEFLITDLETTGPAKGQDRIIDIAAIKLQGGIERDRFESLINPEMRISSTIHRLTGINDEMVRKAPTIETLLPDFLRFAKGGVFVAHNALFDFAFISHEVRRLNLEPLHKRIEICTFRMARKLLPDLKACGLNGLCEFYGYQMMDRHRAMPDVEATAYFLTQFLADLKERGVNTLHQLIRFQLEALSDSDVHKKIKRYKRKL